MRPSSALLLLLVAACSKTSEHTPASSSSTTPTESATPMPMPPHAQAPPPTAMAMPSGGAAAPNAANDLAWDVPAKWETAASASSMRKATYKVPKSAGDPEDGEMSVTQVGGSVDANIDRWVGQFGGAKEGLKRTEQKVGTLKVTVVELSGKFTGGGMPGAPPTGPKEDWALLAAIVEPLDPPYFFKLTGPKKTLKDARPDFDRLVKSFRPK